MNNAKRDARRKPSIRVSINDQQSAATIVQSICGYRHLRSTIDGFDLVIPTQSLQEEGPR